VVLLGLLWLWGLRSIPLLVGSVSSLGALAAVLLPFCIIMAVTTKMPWRWLFLADIALFAATIFTINYTFVWWLVFAGSLLIMVLWVAWREVFDGRWMFLPTFFLILALFFIIVNPQITWLPVKPLEFALTHGVALETGLKALRDLPVVGSGPGTFGYNFLKYREQSLNQGALWNIEFDAAPSRILTQATTTGALGLVAFLLLILLPILSGVGYFFRNRGAKNSALVMPVLVLVSVQTVTFFFYNSNMVLDVVYFFALAALVALISHNTKNYALQSSSLLTLVVIIIFTVLFIFGLGFLALEGQRYVADVQYHKGVVAAGAGDVDTGIQYLQRAAANNARSEDYLTQLALLSLSKAQRETDAAKVRALVSQGIAAATKATVVNPHSMETWSTRGYVCQNLIGIATDALDCAIASYDKALGLAPTNPYLLVQEGNAYLVSKNASKAKEKFDAALALKPNYALAYYQLGLAHRALNDTVNEFNAFANAQKNAPLDVVLDLQIGLIYYQDKNYSQAQSAFKKALILQPNYANALYFLGLTHDWQGQKDKAIIAFEKVLELNPGNENVEKILANLRGGKGALAGLVQEPPAPLPSKTPENPTQKAP
jgi:cytochrome c-type biogenesis protein CcmH/NrfG